MKTTVKTSLLCGAVLAISAGCNSNPAETTGAVSKTSSAATKSQPEVLKNTPAKAYSNAPPDVQAQMAKMAEGVKAKDAGH